MWLTCISWDLQTGFEARQASLGGAILKQQQTIPFIYKELFDIYIMTPSSIF